MAALFAALLAAVVTISDDRAAALAHRATLPPADQQFAFYATVEHIDPEGRESAKIAFKLAMASASPAPVLEHCVPVELSPTLMFFDLRLMQFGISDWHSLITHDPYRQAQHTTLPLCSGADWLTIQLSDQKLNPVYYRLIFGGKIPATRDLALDALGVDKNPSLRIAMIEGASQVAANPAHVRFMENLPISRGSAWGTRDIKTMEAHKDPLERLDGTFVHDAEEWIIHRRKTSLRTGREGALAAYFLANGQGAIQAFAPVDTVRDAHAMFRDSYEIRVPGGCIACHQSGYNFPSRNELIEENIAGTDRYAAKYGGDVEIQAKLFTDLSKHLKRGNEDYAIAVEDGLGVKPVTAAASFQLATSRYDEPVTLATAARELYVTPEELREAIANESNRPATPMTTRVAGLAQPNRTIPREAFEEAWQALWFLVHKWEPKPQ